MTPDPKTHQALACLLQDLRSDPDIAVDLKALDNWSHRRAATAALDGKIPAERINGRWYYRKVDRVRIAEILGVMPQLRTSRPHQHQAVAAPSSPAVAA